jgi:hypothetical protein
MTKHKPWCDHARANNYAADGLICLSSCTCGADKPTPPDEVREALDRVWMRLAGTDCGPHFSTLLAALDEAKEREAEALAGAHAEQEVSREALQERNALRADLAAKDAEIADLKIRKRQLLDAEDELLAQIYAKDAELAAVKQDRDEWKFTAEERAKELAEVMAWAKGECECCAGMKYDTKTGGNVYSETCYGCKRYGEDEGTPDLWTPAWEVK